MDKQPTIEIRNLSKFFGNIIALKDVSFEVYKGEVTALLGDNGAGKSTLIKTLSGGVSGVARVNADTYLLLIAREQSS